MKILSFRRIPIYIKLYTNYIEVVRLDNGKMLASSKNESFSSSRQVLAYFQKAEDLLRKLVSALILEDEFLIAPSFNILAQQMENFEGGLSQIEERAIADACENIGGVSVKVLCSTQPLSTEQALQLLDLR